MHVGDSGNIFVEKRHPLYPHVIDFLVSCCEPVSRTQHVEQYQLNTASLSAASAEGTYTMDMVRNILRYFRVDSRTGDAPLDRATLATLEEWSASREAAEDPLSYVRCLSMRGSHLASFAVAEVKSEDGVPLEKKRPALPESKSCEHSGIGAADPPRRRGLKLTLHFSAAAAAAAAANEAAGRVLRPDQPLIALAVREPDWQPAPLSKEVEQAIKEEEGSSRMRIVLQPRLRRFTHGAANLLRGSRHSNASGEASSDDELFYFLVSSDRSLLEKVTAGPLRDYLEPVMLHGSPRWILSDVDRNAQEAPIDVRSGRPATLHRLYASGGTQLLFEEGTSNGSRKSRSSQGRSSSRLVFKTQIKPGRLRNLKECLFSEYGLHADCVYDHLQDPHLHVDGLSLAHHVRLRPYQTASLERFQQGGKAHQGVVVLPCGAGKTLTGIGAAAIMQKRTIVMCINNMSVVQWQREFVRWTNLSDEDVTICTAKEKAQPGKVFITTYNMLVAKRGDAVGAVARASEEVLRQVRAQSWGLLILDEVHTALAHHFQEVLNQLRYKCVLGLSATLLREDDKISNLRHLVGPKLYEANWLDLTRAGFLAKVECAEVQCPVPIAFFERYLASLAGEEGSAAAQRRFRQCRRLRKERGYRGDDDDLDNDDGESGDSDGSPRRRRAGGINSLAHNIAASNPYKLWCTQALLEFHQNRSPPDKVIIFCDYLADVRFYAYHLHLPFMDQRTSESERANLLQYFQFSDSVNAIILTRVGDVALDLPCASVIIQISGLGASRRQEAQRLGRILRPKPPALDNAHAYFYTLVSQDTHEVRSAYGRQSWLRDQGFAYRVLRSDQVLLEFARVGGVPCCIGPPQWWYQIPSLPGPPAASDDENDAHTQGERRGAVVYAGATWAPFSPAASARIHYFFNRGKPGCTLEGHMHLGPLTSRPTAAQLGGCAVGDQESWTVRFSSANAPRTFGSVIIGEAPVEESSGSLAGGVGTRVRRIAFGTFRQPHDCLDENGPCIAFALQSLGAKVEGGAAVTDDD